MNNEIKEILDFKENADYKKLSCDEIAILRDYITNLQQENDDLKGRLENAVADCNLRLQEFKDYKSRIDKAVEYIKQQTTDEETGKDLGYSDNIDYEYLLNILNGRSDE